MPGSAGSNSTAVIGRVSSSYGAGRLLMRFPGLIKQTFMNSNYTITSAKLSMKEVSGQSETANIYAYNYTGPAWSEATTYNSSIWNGVGTYLDYWWFDYPNNTTKSFNILSAVKSWQTNPTQGAKGIILKNNTSESDYSKSKSFYTSEGATKPYLSVTYFFNGCKVAKSSSSTSINCQGFAFFTNNWPSFMPTDIAYCELSTTTVAQALARTKTRMGTWLNTNFSGKWREVSSFDATLASNEWLVAMRVGKNSAYGFDYHYWYRANNGRWYNKHGSTPSEECSGNVINPSIANSSNGWKLGTVTNFYSSDTVYYAVKQ